MSQATKPSWGPLAWGLARTPLLLVVLYMLRHPVLNAIERAFDIIWITETTVDLMSTPLSRLLLAVGVFAVLVAIWAATRRLGLLRGYLAAATLGAGVVIAVVAVTAANPMWAVLISGLLIVQWLPAGLVARSKAADRAADLLVALPPVAGEAALTSRYLAWIARAAGRPLRNTDSLLIAAVPGALVTALALGVFVNGAVFVPFERSVREGKDVSVIAKRDINGLALDRTGRYLLVTGHGAPQLLKYDVTDWSATQSVAPTGGAQGLAYDPAVDEAFLLHPETKQVQVFDTVTLALKRAMPAPDLSPGDPWIGVDRAANTIVLASEADIQTGWPLLVLDRTTGAVLDRRREEVGNLLSRPDRSLVYFSFFRRGQGVLAYDLKARKMAHRGDADERVDRMAYDAKRTLMLAASPVEGRILRYGADDLSPRGDFPTLFGARVIAIDETRDLMLVGSFATGKIAAQDMATGKILKTWYIGPWLRTIVTDARRGQAYVSSNGWLYRLDYSAVR